MRPLLPAAALLLALGHGGAPAAAASPPTAEDPQVVPLRWQAPPACPPLDAVERRIEALLGGPFAVHGVEAEAIVEPAAGGWSLALTTRRGALEERRTLEARECETLANALALVLAVLADPVAVGVALAADEEARVAEPVRPPPPPPPPTPESQVPKRGDGPGLGSPESIPLPGAPLELTVDDVPLDSGLEEDAEQTAAEPFTWSLRLAGGAEFGALPSASGGLAGAVAARRGRGGIELSGLYVFPRTAAIPALSGASVWSRLWTIGARGCGSPLQGDLELPLCAGLELGALDGEGRGLLAPERQRRLWLALVAAPSLRWSFSEAVALWIGGELAVPLVAPTYVVDLTGSTTDLIAHRASPVTGRVLVGFEVRLSPRRSRADRP
jgi:hypothetical protein